MKLSDHIDAQNAYSDELFNLIGTRPRRSWGESLSLHSERESTGSEEEPRAGESAEASESDRSQALGASQSRGRPDLDSPADEAQAACSSLPVPKSLSAVVPVGCCRWQESARSLVAASAVAAPVAGTLECDWSAARLRTHLLRLEQLHSCSEPRLRLQACLRV